MLNDACGVLSTGGGDALSLPPFLLLPKRKGENLRQYRFFPLGKLPPMLLLPSLSDSHLRDRNATDREREIQTRVFLPILFSVRIRSTKHKQSKKQRREKAKKEKKGTFRLISYSDRLLPPPPSAMVLCYESGKGKKGGRRGQVRLPPLSSLAQEGEDGGGRGREGPPLRDCILATVHTYPERNLVKDFPTKFVP